jgi:tripartite-type tricarboxylate transporter receptor subunit TctC
VPFLCNQIVRKALVTLALVLAALPWVCASGQDYPTRPIRLVVGFAVGSGVDVAARVLGEKMREELGQPIVVDVRAGADGIIAARHVATAAPDGYTLLPSTNGTMAISPAIQDKLPFDPLRDFEPISMIARHPQVLVVTPSLPVNSVRELVAYAKSHPGELNYGSGSASFMFAMEMFKQLTGTDIHHIPYIGVPAAVTALLAGDVQVAIANTVSSTAHVKAGKLKALAVTGATREPLLPDVPTLAEAGVPGYTLEIWTAMFAPAGTPPEIIARLHTAIVRSVDSPEVRDKLAATGVVPVSSSPQFVRETIVRDTKAYAGLAKALRATSK